MLGEPSDAEQDDSIATVDKVSVDAVLVTTRSSGGKVRVAGLATLKVKREEG